MKDKGEEGGVGRDSLTSMKGEGQKGLGKWVNVADHSRVCFYFSSRNTKVQLIGHRVGV